MNLLLRGATSAYAGLTVRSVYQHPKPHKVTVPLCNHIVYLGVKMRQNCGCIFRQWLLQSIIPLIFKKPTKFLTNGNAILMVCASVYAYRAIAFML